MTKALDLGKLLGGAYQLPSSSISSLAANKLTGQLADANAPSGSVIQVVNAQNSTDVSSSSIDTPLDVLSASITPISTSSKIVVIGNIPLWIFKNALDPQANTYIKRNGSIIFGAVGSWDEIRMYINYNANASFIHRTPYMYVDSPNTTSSTTYTIGMSMRSGTTIQTVGATHKSQLILMEIAG